MAGNAGATVQSDANGKITFSTTSGTLAEELAAVQTLVTTDGEVAFFELNDGVNGVGTYVYQENTGDGKDLFVFLKGVQNIADISNSSGDADTLFIF